MATTTSLSSPRTILPPIISNERDRVFMNDLSVYIDEELAAVDASNPDQRYIIYRAAFDKIIEHVHAYQPILTAIQAEYEECIHTIVRGKQEASYLNGKLKALASEPSTLRNYKKRCDELSDRCNIVRGNNEILADELEQLRAARRPQQDSDSETESRGRTPREPDHRLIPGMSIEECTDPALLEHQLSKLQRQLRELQVSRHIQYKPKNEADKLKEKLEEKERQKEHFQSSERGLKNRFGKMRVAHEAAKLYNELAGPYTQESIGDVILEALRRYKRGESLNDALASVRRVRSSERVKSDLTFDEDEPSKDKDSDGVMEYIHKYNQLMEEQAYSQAAVHAANSPQGVLRTISTLNKFKEASPAHPGDAPPLLMFVCALMASVRAVGVLPDDVIADECVTCALENGKLELLQHWVAHQLFTPREVLGDKLESHCRCPGTCVCGCQAMAESMYVLTGAAGKASRCMLRQGRVKQAVKYGLANDCLSRETCVSLLEEQTNPQLARLLMFPLSRAKLPAGRVCSLLIKAGHNREACDLMNDVLRGDGGAEFLSEELDSGDLTDDDWQTIAEKCRHNGRDDVSIHLMAAVTVRAAMKTAVARMKESEN